MKIKKVAFWDNLREWRFEPIYFSNLALLVGVSGVGKTKILEGILSLQKIANGVSLNGLAWDITFSTVNDVDDVEYRWQGEFESKKTLPIILNEEDETNEFRIVREHLLIEGNVIIERTPNEIIFKGNTTPKLSPFQSVVEILNQEDDILPAHEAFNKITSNNSSSMDYYDINYTGISNLLKSGSYLRDIKESDLPIQIKLAFICSHFSDLFNKIKGIFIQAFPQVEGLKIEAVREENSSFMRFPIQIKEKGVKNWIFQNNISSGMLKTLIHISELYLSPEGTVILIDEFENSLGINCIDVVTDLLVENRNIQFILTSHHPYIINNIGMEHWKIVTRKGGVVTVKDAKDLNLGKSRHQAFTQLINLEEYNEGINVE